MSKTVFASEPQKLSIMRTSWVANETFKHHVCHTNKAEGALMNNRLTPICNEEYISFYLCLLRFSQTCEFWSSKANWLTIAFFTAVNHLNGPLRKQNFTLTGSKGQGLWFVIGGFRSFLCVSMFPGSFLVIVIMIDGSEKRTCEGGFWTLESACLWKAQ